AVALPAVLAERTLAVVLAARVGLAAAAAAAAVAVLAQAGARGVPAAAARPAERAPPIRACQGRTERVPSASAAAVVAAAARTGWWGAPPGRVPQRPAAMPR